MKPIAKICIALLLALTISFGGLHSSAHAGAGAAAVAQLLGGADLNKTIDQILGLFSFKEKYSLVIVNKTDSRLKRVGSYNSVSSWPADDIEPNQVLKQPFKGDNTNSFSFAGNYQTDDNKYFQFVATWPFLGSIPFLPQAQKKIGLDNRNQDKLNDAKRAWDNTWTGDDKQVDNYPYTARALIKQVNGTFVWVYEIEKVKEQG